MKKLTMFLATFLVTLTATAKIPQLAVEKFVGNNYNDKDNVTTVVERNKDGEIKFSLNFQNNPKLAEDIVKAILKDEKKADESHVMRSRNGVAYKLEYEDNEEEVTVKYKSSRAGSRGYLTISREKKSAKINRKKARHQRRSRTRVD